ncbi:MAG: hypothetical protein L3J52_10615 [Proteobacteria bacterium]|nr:hypothetical protein [Pseudomonadota bacterium]
MGWNLNNFLIAGAMGLVTFVVCLLKIKLYSQTALQDHANERSLHDGKTMTGAGIFMVVPLVFGVAIQFPDYWIIYLVLALSILGFQDDKHNLPKRIRILAQLLIAGLLVYYFDLSNNIPIMVFLLISTLWWLNLFNFMDGANGMSGLHVLVASLVYTWLLGGDSSALQLLLYGTIAVTMVYLYFNFPAAKMFMGDSGSLSLALLLAIFAFYGIKNGIFSYWFVALIHSVFIVDATLTVLMRILKGERFLEPHSQHFFQRLIKHGLAHWQVSLLYATLTLVFSLIAIYLINFDPLTQWLVTASVYLTLILIFIKTRQFNP